MWTTSHKFKWESSPFYSQKINKNKILQLSMTENKSQARFVCRSLSGQHFWGTASLCTAKIISDTVLKLRLRPRRETDKIFRGFHMEPGQEPV